MAAPKKTLRVFCFGDSLTAGYSCWGTVYHPYSEVLQQRLAAEFPDTEVTVLENGMPGDVVCAPPFVKRLKTERTIYPLHFPAACTESLSMHGAWKR
jgi:hypothetical protein